MIAPHLPQRDMQQAADFTKSSGRAAVRKRKFLHPAGLSGMTKRGSPSASPFLEFWSGRRVSNSRPQPWQGCALPTELLPHFRVQRRMRIVRLFSDLSRASRKISASPPSSSGRRSVLMCLASGFGNASSTEDEWSQRRGSNPYALVGRRILSPLRLPVSSLWDLFRSKKRGT